MLKLIPLVLMFTANAFAGFSVQQSGMDLKVAIATTEAKCIETDLWDEDPSYDCNVNAIYRDAAKQFNNVVKVEGLNTISREVLTNSVDDEGTYKINIRIQYY